MAEIIIKNPDAPATKKQLFALFIATGIDHRGKGLTVKEASELPISNLKNGNEKKTKKYAEKQRFLLTR